MRRGLLSIGLVGLGLLVTLSLWRTERGRTGGARLRVSAPQGPADPTLRLLSNGRFLRHVPLDPGETSLVVPPGDVELELGNWTTDGFELLGRKALRARAGEEVRVTFEETEVPR